MYLHSFDFYFMLSHFEQGWKKKEKFLNANEILGKINKVFRKEN